MRAVSKCALFVEFRSPLVDAISAVCTEQTVGITGSVTVRASCPCAGRTAMLKRNKLDLNRNKAEKRRNMGNPPESMQGCLSACQEELANADGIPRLS